VYNPLSIDYILTQLPHAKRDNITDMSPSRFAYINCPVTVGLNGEVSLNTNVALYGEINGGMNISKISNAQLTFRFTRAGSEEGTIDAWSYYSIVNHHVAFDFTYIIEGGIIINDLVTVGIKYNALSNREHRYTLDVTEREMTGTDDPVQYVQDGMFEKALRMATVSVFVGIKIYHRDQYCYSCMSK
jgi:hypothetical protein